MCQGIIFYIYVQNGHLLLNDDRHDICRQYNIFSWILECRLIDYEAYARVERKVLNGIIQEQMKLYLIDIKTKVNTYIIEAD